MVGLHPRKSMRRSTSIREHTTEHECINKRLGSSQTSNAFRKARKGNEHSADNHTIGSRSRSPQPNAAGGSPQAQAQGTSNSHYITLTIINGVHVDSRPRPTILLHGRQVPRLLHHHHRLLARPNRRRLRRLLTGPLPTYWW